MIRVRVACAALVLLVTSVLTAPAHAGASSGFTDADGIHVVSAQRVDDRLVALSVSSAALGRAVRVRILLPTGYAQHPTTRYPVLYLFHGTSGGADDWVTMGDAEATTAGLPFIVVLPDAGFDSDGGSWFTNWWDTKTRLGPSRWETFHIAQLVPWVDANLRTIAARSGRAIAGLSQGGFGAMTYAARHPDMFAAAGSFSGAPDIASNPVVETAATAVIEATATGLDGVEPAAMFGPHLTNEINWQGHNPATLVTNLRATGLFLYTATGIPGALDGPNPNPGSSVIEALTHVSTLSFTHRADAEGVPYYLDDYGYGTHSWPYWAQDLRDFVPRLMAVFASPTTPATVSYTSVDATWRQWGWTVVNHRTRPAFSALADAGAHSFTMSGLGSATVTTPAAYRPWSIHRVLVDGTTSSVRADLGGHLTISVALHTALDLTPGTAHVTIS